MTTVDEKLMCHVMQLAVDFDRHVAHIRVAEGHCVDMQGAIDLATSLDPDVARIETVSGMKPDTRYRKDLGEWQAIEATPVGEQDAVRE